MKKFRLLAAMIITVAMLCTVALAAEIAIDAPEYNGTDDTYTVTVKVAKEDGLEIGGFSTLALGYDDKVFTVNSATSEDSEATWTETTEGDLPEGTSAYVYNSGMETVTLAKDTALMIINFTVNDKTAVDGKTFEIVTNDFGLTCFCDGSFAEYDVVGINAKATVAQQKEAPTYTEVTDGEGVFQGEKDIYTGVWTGAYTVTLNGNAADKVKVDFDADHSYEVEADAAGEGAIAFKIAVVGAPKNAKAVPSVFGTEWVAAVKAE